MLDGNTLEPVVGATITVARPTGDGDRPAITTKSDSRGLYELSLPPGKHAITVRARRYERTEELLTVPAGGLPDHVFFMVSDDGAGEVIEIVVESPVPPPPGRQDLGREVITRIPGTRGDALQSVKSLPGVANVNANGPGASNIVIRGAAPEDSKVMVDGVEVPLLYHFGGLQSFIPSEFIQNIEFVPGGFGVEEGRSTGGVINVVTRTDAVAKPEGFVEFSFINLAALVQAPVNKQKTAFFSAAVRRSAIDFILPLIPLDLKFVTAPKYYDAQARFVWTPSARHRVSAFGFLSIDKLGLITEQLDPNEPDFTGKFDLSTEFYRFIGSWAYAREDLNNRLTISGGTTEFGFDLGATNSLQTSSDQLELRNDTGVKLSDYVTLRFGANGRLDYRDLFATLPAFPGEGELPTGTFSDGPRLEYDEKFTYHLGAGYVATDVRPRKGTVITAGARLDYYDRLSAAVVQPRLALSQELAKDWTLRLAAGQYSRGLEQAESVPDYIKPEVATQFVANADFQATGELKLTLSGYYTDKRKLVVRDELLAQTSPEEAYTNRGRGRSFGAEILARAQYRRFFGWVAYTVSRSSRVDFEGDVRRLFDFDQTHNFVAVGSYRWKKWELGGRFQASSGEPDTPIVGSTYLADINAYIPVFGEQFSIRKESAHQLDIRVDRHWRFKTWKLSAFLDVTNVYAHPRVLGYSYNFDYSKRQNITDLPIIPALGVRGAF